MTENSAASVATNATDSAALANSSIYAGAAARAAAGAAAGAAADAAFAAAGAADATAHAADATAHAADATADAADATNAAEAHDLTAAAAAYAAARAARAAADADSPRGKITKLILIDFLLLVKIARTENWSDSTPVPPTVFSEMWPDGAPEWAKEIKASVKINSAVFASSLFAGGFAEGNATIELWIEPGIASQETLSKVLIALSELHIAAGGAGLEYRADGDYVHTRERAET